MPAPIVLFAFNRPNHLQRTLASLAGNLLARQSDLTIFCDGPRSEREKENTDAVRLIAHATSTSGRFKSVRVVERTENLGCANAVISGLNESFAEHERLIVFEDDILTSAHTLVFLNEGLERYADYKTVWNIAAWSPPSRILPIEGEYPYDVFAIPRFNCWGWASWRDRLTLVDWSVSDYNIFRDSSYLQRTFNRGGEDLSPMLRAQMEGDLNTWDIRVDYARFKFGGVGINPVRSYTTNIGLEGGTHTNDASNYWDNDVSIALEPNSEVRWLEHIIVDIDLCRLYHRAVSRESLLMSIKRNIRNMFNVLARIVVKGLR